MKGLCPRPLDDGTAFEIGLVSRVGLEVLATVEVTQDHQSGWVAQDVHEGG